MSLPEILLINLDRSPDRLAFMAGQFDRLGLAFTRLPATDGADISETDFGRLADTYMRPISKSELGCLTSHMRAWRHCVDAGRPALVLEDDAFLSDRLPVFLAELADLHLSELVNLETRGIPKRISRRPFAKADKSGVKLHTMYIDRGGAAGYIVTPQSAKALLDFAAGYAAPADAFIDLSGVARLQTEPGLVAPLFRDKKRPMKNAFKSTMKTVSKADRTKLLWSQPRFKLRRLAGYISMTLRTIRTFAVAVTRRIEVCPTIVAHRGA